MKALRNGPAAGVIRKPQDSLGYRLWQVHHHWQRFLAQRLTDLDLTHLQFTLLSTTHFFNGMNEVPSQRRLSIFLHCDQMMVSKSVRKLETKGYIVRKIHPDDSRAIGLQLTKPGESVLKDALLITSRAHKAFFGVLGAEEHGLANSLQRLLDIHRADGKDS